MREWTVAIAKDLKVLGLINIQFAIQVCVWGGGGRGVYAYTPLMCVPGVCVVWGGADGHASSPSHVCVVYVCVGGWGGRGACDCCIVYARILCEL